MKIRIPDLNGQKQYIENKSSIVLIGANGAGKTRMSVWIDENNPEYPVHRVSAQKSLNMPQIVRPTEISTAEEEFLYGTTDTDKKWLYSYGKKNRRWGNAPETFLLNDYEKLMQYLVTEEYEKAIEYRTEHKSGAADFDNVTRLEKIKEIWENVISHRKLKISAGKIEVSNCLENGYYNGSEMSDGERAVFYFIGEVLCAKENSLIIIDELENHLHKSILPRLWDAVEKEREDCVFLYITHDLEFARSRMQSQIIWVKEFEKENQWQYELLDDADASDGLKLEILGNRQNVLLVEGTQTRSIDKKLYSKLYPEYNVISMESCNAVIQAVKTYGQTGQLHYMKVKGIVDRDRRSDSEVEKLRSQNIFVPKVAEVESLFLLPEVIEAVAQKQDKEHPEEIIRKVKERTIEFLSTHKNSQALLFTQQRCLNYITEQVSTKASTMELYKNNLNNIHANLKVEEIYTQELSIIDKIISEKDFMSALKIINDKGLLPDTKLPNEFGWKKEYYIDYVLKLVSKRDEVGNRLRENMRRYVFEE